MEFFDVLKSIFSIFLMVAWIWVLVIVIGDVFRSSDLGGLGKGFWMLFIIIIPWVGVLFYIILRGGSMHERSEQAHLAAADKQRAYIQSVAGLSTADELSKLAELKEKGVISDAEFETQKAKLLN